MLIIPITVSNNAETDPVITPLEDYAAADTTDVTGYGFANCLALTQEMLSRRRQATGFLGQTLVELTRHSVGFEYRWESAEDHRAFYDAIHADTNFITPYKALLARYRTAFNITTDPAPETPPYYFP